MGVLPGGLRHVVWDWNGTLVADFAVVTRAVNAALAVWGGPPVGEAAYRSAYCRPLRAFNEKLLGRPLSDADWVAFNDRFLAEYRAALGECLLAEGALDALEAVRRAGAAQSLLSMWRHEELLPAAAERGVSGFFVLIEGSETGEGLKTAHLAEHLRHLNHLRHPGRHAELAPDEVVVVGDTLDDAAAAAAAGVHCLLVAEHSSHHPADLRAVAPTVDDLHAAAGELAAALAG